MRFSNGIFFCLVFGMTFTSFNEAEAYLDPGTGSMVLQLLLGGVAGAVVVVRLYWEKVKSFFSREKIP
jgi:hypothetical protein